jgi:predicted nucleic acid-binding protein
MPESGRLVVVSTTPIIALAIADQLTLLQHLYSQITIPPAVQAEVIAGGTSGVGVQELQAASWVRVMPLQDPRRADLLTDLDRGEAEVLALAQELNAGLVIIDERLARRHARNLGLPLTGTLGVLLRAKQLHLIPAVQPLITAIQNGGIWLSDSLVAEALTLAREC